MTTDINWSVPPSVLRWLAAVPADRPVSLLLRHSVRPPLPDNDGGADVPLTDDGWRIARELGALLGSRLRSVRTSPMLRCVQTAAALQEAAGVPQNAPADRLLGSPGIFVVDGKRAWSNWQTLGHEGVMAHLVSADEALPGMAHPDAAARALALHLLATAGSEPGVHVFVTHDLFVTAMVARIVGAPLGPEHWPEYLEGAFVWRQDDGLHVAYRDHHMRPVTEPLCSFSDTDVVEFARREIGPVLGFDSGAHFYLAGGAFKSLLTGRPPHDLDVWGASEEDRRLLVQALEARGARRLPQRPFGEAFEIRERVVEVPYKVETGGLASRFGRFDIGLAAVGVEHRPGEPLTALVHPLALESIEKRQVLLLKPLVNWKYALTTLERMRRYAAELEYYVPADEEEEVWRVFGEQGQDERAAMVRRYMSTGRETARVRGEVACKCS